MPLLWRANSEYPAIRRSRSQADPVVTPSQSWGIEDGRSLPELLFTPEEEDVTAMEEAGFESGVVDRASCRPSRQPSMWGTKLTWQRS